MKGLGCLMVDLQDCFLKAIPESDKLINRAAFVLESCRLLGIQVYFSEQVPEKLGSTLPRLLELCEHPYTFGKDTFSAWRHEGLQNRLKADEITHLLVGGIETTICVYQSILEARSNEMEITLLSDVVACRRAEDAPAVIRTLQDHQTLHLPSESVFYSILQSVKHPAFRDYTNLVKRYSA